MSAIDGRRARALGQMATPIYVLHALCMRKKFAGYRLLPHEYSCRSITSLLLTCGCSRSITVLLLTCMNIHELIWTITLCLCTLCGSHIAVQLPVVCMASVVSVVQIGYSTRSRQFSYH